MSNEPRIRIERGPLTESSHRVHIAVVDGGGRMIAHAGDPYRVTFARSAAKPIQAVPVIEAGARERFGLTGEQIALLCASHNGEPEHVAAAADILSRIGLSDEALRCGPHYPYHEPSADRMKRAGERPTRLHNNCSGKHAGMLALARLLDASPDGYMEPGHPVQRAMLAAVADMSGVPADRIPLGTDGCGVPVFGLPLDRLAFAFATLARPDRLDAGRADACRTIADAIRRHPHYIAGTDRFDTRLVQATGGRLIGKMGAEGVFALASQAEGAALAVKIEDGSLRALYPAVVEALIQLEWIGPDERDALAPFHRPPVRNWSGDEVGAVVPDFRLL
ncbi:asparaginase [Paenibacillus flagellatus]|uniref:Asparaginase n=1 Tax=Paenibacillus flagellatus TaxID=2211139 RepID=A0A2V5K571_9BACL|nr:asparaginase [Paenibacillus flagellatus]PYI54388.1 asparaginase [Paenibacillus flagellatus]